MAWCPKIKQIERSKSISRLGKTVIYQNSFKHQNWPLEWWKKDMFLGVNENKNYFYPMYKQKCLDCHSFYKWTQVKAINHPMQLLTCEINGNFDKLLLCRHIWKKNKTMKLIRSGFNHSNYDNQAIETIYTHILGK